jgi:hypothetical protein
MFEARETDPVETSFRTGGIPLRMFVTDPEVVAELRKS